MTRAAIYARVSTDDQDGEDRSSLDEQMAACAALAESKGWEVVHTFSDVESGISRKRPGFKALQGAALSGEIDMIVVWKSDRLFRELGPAADLADAITPNGVGLQSVTDIVDTVTLGLMAGIASMERKAFLDRTRMGKQGAARAGLVPVAEPPFGYRRGADRRPVIHESEAAVVRRIFDESVEGKGIVAITAGLNADHAQKRSGPVWHNSLVGRILRREAYAGRWQYADTGITVPFPAIVEPDVWEAAQEARRSRVRTNRRNTKRPFLLQYKMTCSECGRPFAAVSDSRSKRRYYVCQGVRVYKQTCRQPKSIKAADLEVLVWGEITSFLSDAGAIQASLDATTDLKAIDRDIKQLRRDLSRLDRERERLVWLFTSDRIDVDRFDAMDANVKDRRAPVEVGLKALEAQRLAGREAATVSDSVVGWADALSEGLPHQDFGSRRDTVREVIDSATIDRHGNVGLRFKLPIVPDVSSSSPLS